MGGSPLSRKLGSTDFFRSVAVTGRKSKVIFEISLSATCSPDLVDEAELRWGSTTWNCRELFIHGARLFKTA